MAVTNKGHGRLERREVRTSGELEGYSDFPGLKQVVEVKKTAVRLKTGEVSGSIQYGITSLGAEQAGAARLLKLMRGHWGIENGLFHVKDDSFGEDRQVLHNHQSGTVASLLRAAALNLLRGCSPLWKPSEPLVLQRRVVLQGNSWADFEAGNERVRVSHDERSVAEEEDLIVFSHNASL